jgi:hypothetical protein
MRLLERLKSVLALSPSADPERDERRRQVAARGEPSATPEEPEVHAAPSPQDDDWLSNRERLGPGV